MYPRSCRSFSHSVPRFGLGLLVLAWWGFASVSAAPPELRKAETALAAGNYQDAFHLYERVILGDADLGDEATAKALDSALWCLPKIKRTGEFDAFAEKAVQRHPGNWRLLWTAARNYLKAPHLGYMIAGQFSRGPHRGGGAPLDCFERDRARALQLMDRALKEGGTDPDREARAAFCLDVAEALLGGRQGHDAWRLQYLTDLSTLPDRTPTSRVFYGFRQDGTRGAPVDREGRPIFHALPASWESARSDGERWRSMLRRAGELDASRLDEIRLGLADFLHEQFGVQTLRQYDWWRRIVGSAGDTREGVVDIHTLTHEETIARLASGVRRFSLPDEFNYIKTYAALAQSADSDLRVRALKKLAALYENRRQYTMASNCWQNVLHVLKQEGAQAADRSYRDAHWRLQQITANWGAFEAARTQAAGEPAALLYRFRNGNRAGFNARRVKLDLLIQDAKRHIKSRPSRLAHDQINLANLGYRLVRRNEQRYLAQQAEAWVVGLEPRAGHLDKRVRIEAPLTAPGAYLVTATMDRGNMSRIVLWIGDTAIVKKPLSDGGTLLYVADSRTGEPIEGAKLECFGYRQERSGGNEFKVEHREFTTTTDADGIASVGMDKMPNGWQWLITARTDSGRFAFLGWTYAWPERGETPWYEQAKTYFITDRPVYRPGQTARFKVWVRRARYDLDDSGAFGGQDFRVEVRDPQNREILNRMYTADQWGGLAGEIALPSDAGLGAYSIRVPSDGNGVGVSGVSQFRVEEYRKPEFEVLVEAPEEPVSLGDTIQATVRARYYFGEPVRKGRIAYKVTRTARGEDWYPERPWDWLYGRGYWWRASQAGVSSGPGRAPGAWRLTAPQEPPEVVAEGEMDLEPDGTCAIAIDTALAKAVHGDSDHRYHIVSEVTDSSRRTIVGTGDVLAAREAWRLHVFMHRGYARTGERLRVRIVARTADGKPVQADARVSLFRRKRDAAGQVAETLVENWTVRTDSRGDAEIDLAPSKAGRYRIGASAVDGRMRSARGSHTFTVVGADGEGQSFRYDALTVESDRAEYRPGDRAGLLIGGRNSLGTALLFVRPEAGTYAKPQVLRLADGYTTSGIAIGRRDMPNFFVEALTVSGGRVHVVTREIFVPPESRVLAVEAAPSKETYSPGEESTLDLRVTDSAGKPFRGSAVLAVYDRAVERISGGSNVSDIRRFFWQWRRTHHPRTEDTLERTTAAEYKRGEKQMADLGVFGDTVAEDFYGAGGGRLAQSKGSAAATNGLAAESDNAYFAADIGAPEEPAVGAESAPVRREFADTAYWNAAIRTDSDGRAQVRFRMPDDLTGWKVRAWVVGDGTRVGEATAEIVTKKDLLVRLQAPRFLIEGDASIVSANIHNYLDRPLRVDAALGVEGRAVALKDRGRRKADVASGDAVRLDWRVQGDRVGESTLRLSALSDLRSDAMESRLPVLAHGIDKQTALCGHLPPEQSRHRATLFVPGRIDEETARLEIRFSPSLAVAMVDALAYLAGDAHGCTEQTLNRFLPTVLAQKTLLELGFGLEAIRNKRVNLNPQELGEPSERAKGWAREGRNPVFDPDEMARMTGDGIQALADMQLSDGGWGWFSGYGERSDAHTTAWVVRGLLVAQRADATVPARMLDGGIAWLEAHREREFRRLTSEIPTESKRQPDDIDALVAYVLSLAGRPDLGMRARLYADRLHLSTYGKVLAAIAMHRAGQLAERDMLIRNIEQLLRTDRENQTAWLDLGDSNPWWLWHGSETETMAAYLKLLVLANQAHDNRAPWLVKYLLNNRKHGTAWHSTRDTALCVEAMAEYLKATGEHAPEMRVDVFFDGKLRRTALLTKENLFTQSNRAIIASRDLGSGRHRIEIRKSHAGADRVAGPLYYNAYLRYFSKERFLRASGLEARVRRRLYRLIPQRATRAVRGDGGEAVAQAVEKFDRVPLLDEEKVRSGDLVEVELTLESKNDYEHLVVEDPRAAGLEPVDVRSGYSGNGLGAYVEYRDTGARFYVRRLARGKSSLSYRLRAETPGQYRALPAQIRGMYAPELDGNSDEIRLTVEERQ